MNYLVKAISHAKVIIKHRHIVIKLCFKAGIPLRGLLHDLSKFSPTEFFESVKYYEDGKSSPVTNARNINGYSLAEIHHITHNKHHFRYWIDLTSTYGVAPIPYPYWVELICDNIAAGIVYQKDKWSKEQQLIHWEKKQNWLNSNYKINTVHPNTRKAVTEAYLILAKYGIDYLINPKVLKEIYYKNMK